MSNEDTKYSARRGMNLDFSNIPAAEPREDRDLNVLQARQLGHAEGFTSRQRSPRRRAQPKVQVNIKMAPNLHARLIMAFNKAASENAAIRNLGDFAADLLDCWEKRRG